ncbi:MAG: hypothetical protein ACXWBT_19220 [Usitatibacter sp.]
MRKILSLFGVAAALLAFTPGCAHFDRERAEYHRKKARRDAEHGHFVKAAKEERKANRAERKAETDPLP